MQKIEVYTDGSSLGNPGPGGYGVVIVHNSKVVHEIGGHYKDTTNNKMELQAVIETLKYLAPKQGLGEVVIYADSAYVLNGITSWIFNWEKNGWRTANKQPVLNKELWQELIELVRNFKGKILWQKVKGHSGVLYNERADVIATTFAEYKKCILVK
ncbi:ribonuclease HI [Candidatus Nomurabacteria bacterium]|nr:ribonuclease HI [Candidatus Nomurabacteria bacterium]